METGIIYNKSCLKMDELSDNSVDLIVCSPPYGVGVDYGNTYVDKMPIEEYLEFSLNYLYEFYRVLVRGGRLCIVIANTGRKPYIPLNGFLWMLALQVGFLPRGEQVWFKGHAIAAGKTSWGSWKDAKNPQFRDCHENILDMERPSDDEHDKIIVLSKEIFELDCTGYEKSKKITGSDFAYESFSVWNVKPENRKRNPHPAPFPVEIPKRCIEFLTRPDQIVLDPFCGSGNTWIACEKLPEKRRFVGYEINPDYVKLAYKRVKSYQSKKLCSFITNTKKTKDLMEFSSDEVRGPTG